MQTGRIVAGAACAVFLAAHLPGCTTYELITNQGSYLTFQHPFTDATAEDVRKSAVELCNVRKQAALRSASVCTLTRCTTSYQCVDKDDADIVRK